LNIQLEPQWINKLFLAPKAASASVAADHLSPSQHHFQFLKIMNLPWGPSARTLLAQLAADSNEESIEGGYRPKGLHFWTSVSRHQRSRHNFRSPTSDLIPWDSDNIIGAVLSLGGAIGVTITRSIFGVGEGGKIEV